MACRQPRVRLDEGGHPQQTPRKTHTGPNWLDLTWDLTSIVSSRVAHMAACHIIPEHDAVLSVLRRRRRTGTAAHIVVVAFHGVMACRGSLYVKTVGNKHHSPTQYYHNTWPAEGTGL